METKMTGRGERVRLYNVWQYSRDFYTLLMSTTVRNDAYDASFLDTDIITEEEVWVEVPSNVVFP